MAKIKKIVNCIAVKPKPFTKYSGTDTRFPKIQNNQFSIFLFAMSHIPEKKTPVVKMSKYGVIFLIPSMEPRFDRMRSIVSEAPKSKSIILN